jgi:hypothetical protein
MGAGGYSGIDTSGLRGPAVQYGPDYGMPNLQAAGAGDATFEFWFLAPTQSVPGSNTNIQLFELLVQPALGTSGAAGLGGGVFMMGGVSYLSAGGMTWYTQEAWSGSVTSITNLAENVLHHVVLILSGGDITFWIDGVDYGVITGMPLPSQLVGARSDWRPTPTETTRTTPTSRWPTPPSIPTTCSPAGSPITTRPASTGSPETPRSSARGAT